MSTPSKKRFNRSVFNAIFKASVFILLGIVIGINAADIHVKTDYKAELEDMKAKYKDAYYITVDDSGAWLGDSPGHKFQPLYDQHGQRIGAKLNNDTVTSSK